MIVKIPVSEKSNIPFCVSNIIFFWGGTMVKWGLRWWHIGKEYPCNEGATGDKGSFPV